MNEQTVVSILSRSFDTNPSVNFIVKQASNRKTRIQRLMHYSWLYGNAFGKIYLNDSKQSCAIVIYPEKRKTTLKSIWWDIKLIVGCIGLFGTKKALKREAAIKKHHPTTPYVHLWYIGVDPMMQGKGLGTALLQQILNDYKTLGKSVVLETSNPANFPFYEKVGFQMVTELGQFKHPLRIYIY